MLTQKIIRFLAQHTDTRIVSGVAYYLGPYLTGPPEGPPGPPEGPPGPPEGPPAQPRTPPPQPRPPAQGPKPDFWKSGILEIWKYGI